MSMTGKAGISAKPGYVRRGVQTIGERLILLSDSCARLCRRSSYVSRPLSTKRRTARARDILPVW
jgi:hypothetical protein